MSTDEKLIALSKQLSLLIQDFESRGMALSAESKHTAYQLEKVLVEVTQKIQSLLDNSETIIRERTHKAISDATEDSLTKLERRIHNLCDRVEMSAVKMDHSTDSVIKRTKRTAWFALGGISLAILVVLGIAAWYVS